MTRMLQSMKHRGPDSTGYALYGSGNGSNGAAGERLVMRYTLADANDPRDFEFLERIERNRAEVEERMRTLGATIVDLEQETEYAYRADIRYPGDLKQLADYVEDVPGCEVLSLGHSLEIVKDLGGAETVADQYGLARFDGTHAIGHVRM